MTNSGTFPKIDGDKFYAQDVNLISNQMFIEKSGTVSYTTATTLSLISSGLNFGSTAIVSKAYTNAIQNFAYGYDKSGFGVTCSGTSGTVANLSNFIDGSFFTSGSFSSVQPSGTTSATYLTVDMGSLKNVYYLNALMEGTTEETGGGGQGIEISHQNYLSGLSARYFRFELTGSGTNKVRSVLKYSTNDSSYTAVGSAFSTTTANGISVFHVQPIEIIPLFSNIVTNMTANKVAYTSIGQTGSYYALACSGTASNTLKWNAITY